MQLHIHTHKKANTGPIYTHKCTQLHACMDAHAHKHTRTHSLNMQSLWGSTLLTSALHQSINFAPPWDAVKSPSVCTVICSLASVVLLDLFTLRCNFKFKKINTICGKKNRSTFDPSVSRHVKAYLIPKDQMDQINEESRIHLTDTSKSKCFLNGSFLSVHRGIVSSSIYCI